MREVNNNLAGNSANIPQATVKKVDAAEPAAEGSAAFTGTEVLKELGLENDKTFQDIVAHDNLKSDLALLQKNPDGVNQALAFGSLALENHSYEDAAALTGEFTKEFLQ
ncbi:MAG: hypothetical protein LBJ74_00825 [Heliobacteriaceae bacterium]|jgi:hypothetical protein|nr:hypothetical protein [Heliobacteriaceae bacterium]